MTPEAVLPTPSDLGASGHGASWEVVMEQIRLGTPPGLSVWEDTVVLTSLELSALAGPYSSALT